MNDIPIADQQDNHSTSPPKHSAAVARWFGFIGLMLACFFLGFYLVGPRVHRATVPSASSSKVDLGAEGDWGRAPTPVSRPRDRKPAVTVEVDEISPNDKPTETSATVAAPIGENDVTTQPSPSPEPTPAAAPAPPATPQKRYYVQVGVYADKNNAEIVSANLADHGYASSVRQVLRNGVADYQVSVGSPRDRTAADALATELRGAGRDVVVVPE